MSSTSKTNINNSSTSKTNINNNSINKYNSILTLDDKKQLLNNFPYVELSYEKDITHKKVQIQTIQTIQSNGAQSNINMHIPKGPKAFIWFSYWNDKPVCITLPLMPNKKGINIHNIQLHYASFSKDLCLQTIMYGTFFNEKNKTQCFSCEDIFYYKGIPVFLGLDQRILLICSLFRNKEIILSSLIDSLSIERLIIGLPIITSNFKQAEQLLHNLSYEVYAIRVLTANRPDLCGLIKNINTTNKEVKEGIFKVKASINEDIYQLYCFDPTNTYDNSLGIALIPTYKKSVFMNSLFRNIKENKNLDLLEESDDEDEFENANLDKFVDTTKTINMKCVYIKQFRKWEPIEAMIDEKVKLITIKEVYQIQQ